MQISQLVSFFRAELLSPYLGGPWSAFLHHEYLAKYQQCSDRAIYPLWPEKSNIIPLCMCISKDELHLLSCLCVIAWFKFHNTTVFMELISTFVPPQYTLTLMTPACKG